jgi:hypothetical protein
MCPDTYNIVVTDALGCTGSFDINVDGIDCNNFSVTVSAVNETGGCTNSVVFDLAGIFPINLLLNSSNGPVSVDATTTPFTVSNLCTGNYTATVTDSAGCNTTFTFSINAVGIDEHLLENFRTYPNPATEWITLQNLPSEFHWAAFELTLLDMNGQVLMSQRTIGMETKLRLPDLSPGLYFIRLSDDQHSYRAKFVIE